MNRLYEALEISLRTVEDGGTIDTAVAQFPDLADELRPLLEVAATARQAAVVDVPADAKRRGRSAFLQRAAELREARAPRRRMIPAFPRLAMSFALVLVLVLTSTGLVSASSGALPGDQLYGVKRSWEDVRLLLVFQPQDRTLLESEFEQERLDEIDGLLAKRQAASIRFSGLVQKLQDGTWMVSGIPVTVGAVTLMPSGAIAAGAPVMITGTTRSDGLVEAEHVQLLQPGVSLPPLEPSEHEGEAASWRQPGVGVATPAALPQSGTQPGSSAGSEHAYQFTGVVEALGTNAWRINGQTIYVDQTTIIGSVKVGTAVKFEGYYGPDGYFVATKIEADSSSVRSGSGDGGDPGSNVGSGSPAPSGDNGGTGSEDDGTTDH